jgi:CopG family transcriptional regulator / antitoxin EndoAI
MYQNINIHLPDDTLVEIDRLAPQGDRLRFISEAIQFYISEANKKSMRDLLRGCLKSIISHSQTL